jgi:hypothetical protein
MTASAGINALGKNQLGLPTYSTGEIVNEREGAQRSLRRERSPAQEVDAKHG